MPNVNFRTSLTDFIGKWSQRAVRAAHRISALQQEAGNSGKTASPDANEMDVCHFRKIVSCLDINHKNKYKRQDNRKIDAWLAKELRRHIQHHLAYGLHQVWFSRFTNYILKRIICNMHVV